MSNINTFKTRVKNEAIQYSNDFKTIFINNEYLVYSSNFSLQYRYIISAHKSNYLHLIGVHSHLTPNDFFDKAYQKTLTENDFDFFIPNKSEAEVKGSIRRKIQSLKHLNSLISDKCLFEESFLKSKANCSIASSACNVTMGFSYGPKCNPKTLMKGYHLSSQAITPDLILIKSKKEPAFNKIIVGNLQILKEYLVKSKDFSIISPELLNQINFS